MSHSFFPDEITIGNSTYEMDLEADLSIHETDLNHEFCHQAEIFAKYSTAYELALYEAQIRKAALEVGAARLDYMFRMDAKEKNVKMTEKMVENSVKAHEDFLALEQKLLQAQKITGLLKQAKDAIVQRRDMLIQLGSTQRQERASDITMKANHLKDS